MYILKCLVDWNDAQISSQLIAARPYDQFWVNSVRSMLTTAQVNSIILNQDSQGGYLRLKE